MLDTTDRPAPSPTDLAGTDLDTLRARIRALCAEFPDAYWRETDRDRRYPQEFVDTLTAAGLLSVLIPPGTAARGWS